MYRHHKAANEFPVIRYISLDEPIDLLNVAFENPRKIQLQLDGNIGALPKKKRKHLKAAETDSSGDADSELSSYMVPDRATGLQEVEELRRLCPGRLWNFDSRAARPAVKAMMYPSRTVMDLVRTRFILLPECRLMLGDRVLL
ncbi:hypothetical protein J3R82DRAFT_989 [Butyriboletus roseoflavus]|nr:hypothetical protein J3R82DRAFT_989 [Butyriboletus roseoflavus]